MCLLLCLMFALRNNQEQKNALNPWQGSKSKPELQPEVCRPHCPPGTAKNFAKKSHMWLERASVPAAERMLQRTLRDDSEGCHYSQGREETSSLKCL